jgi:hypothetical protein
MRILIIQEASRQKQRHDIRECLSFQRALLSLQKDITCDVWGLNFENYNTTPQFNSYDVIINLENYDTGWVPDLSQYNAPLKFVWAIDSHCQVYDYYTNIFTRGKYNYILQASKPYLNSNSVWFPNCYDDDHIMPLLHVKKQYNVGFCGNVVTHERAALFDAMCKAFPDFRMDIGTCFGPAMVEAINSYKILFNKNISCDVNYRNFESLACMTTLVTSHNDQYAELGFVNDVHFHTYLSADEAVYKVKYLLQNPEKAKETALNGHNFVKKHHTFKNRAKHFIRFVESL